ncbi:hypothetical protein EVAR_22048_1 [Eumeta japonica]|uniref:Uncharacterized protein n=1 Tax=Eumeta variegata TaxID=151549 RepID=A0A4C1UTX5_EUMVA|nr:hypothetical protein EVAR_22048_1 [Eumeta japonica]
MVLEDDNVPTKLKGIMSSSKKKIDFIGFRAETHFASRDIASRKASRSYATKAPQNQLMLLDHIQRRAFRTIDVCAVSNWEDEFVSRRDEVSIRIRYKE